MATLILEDSSGSVEVVLFPDVFNQYSHLLKGDDPLLVGGTAEVDDNSAKIIAQEIISLETVRQKAIKAIELNLHKEIISRELLEEIRDVMSRYPGKCPVLFRADIGRGENFIIAAHNRFKVFPCNEMIGEIESIIGQKVINRYGEKSSNHRQPEHP